MLRMAVACLVIALLAGLFGFDLIEGYSLRAAQVVFFVFLCLAVVAFAADAFHARRATSVPM